ncbi:MAG TPA: sialidase family protein [Phycisphaerae bacterium]|jgi:Neuraminidase (sialidase)|nr:sialidase family protein [Phycisphaerae bacterium]HOJ52947.1 sialidase family protein [Phycisphaerae bacterium]HOL24684.1 sialidase family protein [Phycisphaerae bacterium]HPP19220.1 sialidase family protein [Phycisphaerae bacterium]HPU31393.1 sialidase family protein [Phycisphaerae bacterium]
MQAGTAMAAGVVLGGGRQAHAGPSANVLETRVISTQPQYYHGWPTVARRRNGELLLAWSGGREGHVCPFGRVDYMTSRDGGRTWTWPRTLLDGAIDDRDAGVMETAKGTILVTTFTSLAYAPTLEKAEESKNWPAERLAAWQAVHNRLTERERQADLGEWLLRSTDGGRTWSARIPTILNSPHGPIQLSDGRLLYAGKELWTEKKRVGVCESTDDGQTWRWLSEIPAREGDDGSLYHELHAVEATDGRIIVHIRNHNRANDGETLQTESTDGGKTWSVPRTIGVWGLPSHLLRLKNGHLLMTYGYRRPPFGNQARLSTDNGKSWSEPIIISGDGIGVDLGYPSTVELENGELLTVWYEVMKGSSKAVLRQARWELKG